ncbi:SLC13 family permease [Halolamina salifodinae]|uniref:Di/tricarboxylate transporter n=1 Tax=Halolamina salifodinae TaxID=1202767 RepID=A0A8T4GT23_9EURY|nr:SLC13 family permease [Halolamina salifodinae]MBP1986029.1 di/tricarboxylate transporter [Halolamina salifodinae]
MVAISPGVVIVSLVVLAALVLFATEPVPVDITALGVMVTLMLVEPLSAQLADAGLIAGPVTMITPQQGLSGFASTATITVLAMFILSEGVRRTGIVQTLGAFIGRITGDSETKQLGAITGIVAPVSGFINNTAAVAILLPMVIDVADRGGTSPSKLLLPLSYASMFGGTLTLIGTSTNVLASDVAARLAPQYPGTDLHALGMFEFTGLGIVVMIVGLAYLMTVGRWLTPARIEPSDDLTEEFGIGDYLTEVTVREDSPLVGKKVRNALVEAEFDVDLLQLIRGDEVFLEPLGPKQIQAGDTFTLRTDRDTLLALLDVEGLDLIDVPVDEAELEQAEAGQNLVEVVVAPGSPMIGESLASIGFRQRYNATALALRRGRDVVRRRMDKIPMKVGDTLLIQAPTATIERIDAGREFILAGEVEQHDFREEKTGLAIGIVAAVVALAGIGVLPIVVSALAGSLAMVVTGCLKPGEIYEAVQWDVILLLAGVIPLGIALERTGAATLLAEGVVASSSMLPVLGVLAVFYLLTALLTNVISNNASVVLMIPVAVETAQAVGASATAFLFAVMFAASTAFMTPVGYQTNLFVYGPGGYRFTDYVRVGGPLQLLLMIVTTLGIAVMFGIDIPV